jgi:hypothetical protein
LHGAASFANVVPLLKLSGSLRILDARLAQAAVGDLGHLDFLQVLCEDETSRESVSLAKRIRRDADVREREAGSPRWGCR